MNILVLGGIAESKQLAAGLVDQGHDVVYSIVGMVRRPELDCPIHTGGFSQYGNDGVSGLKAYLDKQSIELLIDATHPYAAEMSAHAMTAIQDSDVPCWRFERPGWDRSQIENIHGYREFADLLPMIEPFQRPFFSIGASALSCAHRRPTHQKWVVRSARPFDDREGIIQINGIGPFSVQDELALMEHYMVDALVSKDSGCSRVSAKLDAANRLGMPVFLQHRPKLVPAHREFDSIDTIMTEIVLFR